LNRKKAGAATSRPFPVFEALTEELCVEQRSHKRFHPRRPSA